MDEQRFLDLVLSNPVNRVVLERGPLLGVDEVVEVRNEARVHLWYEEHFGVPARAFASTRDAIDHVASTTCCYAVTSAVGGFTVYAPHGYDEAKARRWLQEWPRLVVDPW